MIIGQLVPRRRHIAATILLVSLTAATIGANAAANGSPLDTAASVVKVPAEQLRAEVAATVGRTGRPALDVLLERIELSTLDHVYRLAAADDRVGVPVTAAATALLDRTAAMRAAVLASADCLDADLSGAADTCPSASTPEGG